MTNADASTSLQRTYRYLRLAIVGHVFGVFVGEVLALLLFAAFWVLQSVQHWRVDGPAIRAQV